MGLPECCICGAYSFEELRSKLASTVRVVSTPFENRFVKLMEDLETFNAVFHHELDILHFKQNMDADHAPAVVRSAMDSFGANNLTRAKR